MLLKLFLFPLAALFISVTLDAQIITTFAGGLTGVPDGDGGQATSARIGNPVAGSFDAKGNYYFAAGGVAPTIRRVDVAGIISTVAGNGSIGFSGDGGPATAAPISWAYGIVDSSGNIYIPDRGNHRVRKVEASTGIIKTIAGNGLGGHSGDGGPATGATLYPESVCIDNNGNIYVTDSGTWVRKISKSGLISTVAGNGINGYSGDGFSATLASIAVLLGICCDATGNIFIGNAEGRIRKIDAVTGIITTVAGNGTNTPYLGDGLPATNAQFYPYTIALDVDSNMYISDYGLGNSRVLKIDTHGIIYTVAGTGTDGYNGDGGLATAAQIHNPEGIAIDSCGNVYIADDANNRIRKVTYNPNPCKSLVKNLTLNSMLIIYPNPATDILKIDNLQTTADYRLLSMVGAVLQQGGLKEGSNVIDITVLPVGMYLVEVSNAAVGLRMMYKIVKQ